MGFARRFRKRKGKSGRGGLRELKEETNIDNVYIEQLFSWGKVDRDPRTRVISVSYMSLIDSSSLNIKASHDAEDAKWFAVNCKLMDEKKTVTEMGYILEKIYKLILSNQEVEERRYLQY